MLTPYSSKEVLDNWEFPECLVWRVFFRFLEVLRIIRPMKRIEKPEHTAVRKILAVNQGFVEWVSNETQDLKKNCRTITLYVREITELTFSTIPQ